MKVFLIVVLALVIAVLAWAFTKNAFVDNSIFGLALLAVGLCGYLIADFVFNRVKKGWENDQTMYKSEISALKEEKDVLQKQLSSVTPQIEVDDMKKKLYHSEEENRHLNNNIKSQAGDIVASNIRFDRLLAEHNKLKEDSKMNSAKQSEVETMTETLATTKNKLNELVSENEKLKAELALKPQGKVVRVEVPKAEKPIEAVETLKFLNENGKAEIVPTQRIQSRSVSDENPEKPIPIITQNVDNQSSTPIIIEKNKEEDVPTSAQQPHPVYGAADDLKVIEGIGPKIEMILKEAGVDNWHQLSEVTLENLKGILEKAGPRFRLNDPTSWSQQARLLSEGKYDEFKTLTDNLTGGRALKA
jgi:predicted flap endonuclease-1-like 5' DNA nuclease